METMILNLDFMLLNSQNLLKEDLKKLLVVTVNNHTQKNIFGRLYWLDGHSLEPTVSSEHIPVTEGYQVQ